MRNVWAVSLDAPEGPFSLCGFWPDRHIGPLMPAWRAVLLQDPCVYCGAHSTGLDHIHPQSAGGSNGFNNRAPACQVCDGDKGATPLLIFLMRRRAAPAQVSVEQAVAADDAARRFAEFYRGNVRLVEVSTC